MDLPTLDLSLFTNESDPASRKFAKVLVQSFRDYGFVKLINFGIPEETVEDYMRAASRITSNINASTEFLVQGVKLFALPERTKGRLANIKGPWPQRGFSRVGEEQTSKLRKENLKGRASWDDLRDAREHFDAGPPDDGEFPNRWPSDEMPHFQTLMGTCFNKFQAICLTLMRAMEVGLDLPPDTLVERCKPAASELRLNHYPSSSLRQLAEGKDFVGGLELEDRKNPGTFVPVLPGRKDSPREMVVNISDTFQRWTNNVIRAGLHQVSVPPSLKGVESGACPDRYSGIFFFKAHRDTSVGPLPHFVTEDRPAAYDSISSIEYQRRMTKVLY